MNESGNCERCKRPLIEIDHYGESVGCPASSKALDLAASPLSMGSM